MKLHKFQDVGFREIATETFNRKHTYTIEATEVDGEFVLVHWNNVTLLSEDLGFSSDRESLKATARAHAASL